MELGQVLCMDFAKYKTKTIGWLPPFWPILLGLQTLKYNLAKILVHILNPLTKNEYTFKEALRFAEMIYEQDPTLSLGSLYVG